MRLFGRAAAFVLLLACVTQLGSQAGSPKVAFTAAPQFGQDGLLKGYVSGIDANQARLYIFEFLPDLGWYSKPDCSPVPIQGTGEFTVNITPSLIDRNATRYAAYLVPASLSGVPCVQSAEAIPFVIQNPATALAWTTLPRLPGYKVISFSGMNWYVKSAPIKVPAGPQFFVEDNVFVDAQGRLHLRLSRCPNSVEWCAAEIFSKDRVGYGTYTFTIDTSVNNLDPNTTLGLFTWDEQAATQFHRELDIEFARWGNANASFNMQYVVQPYSGQDNMLRFLMSPATQSTHTISWSANQVNFASFNGTGGGGAINQWSYTAGALPVPTPGDVRLHLNYYVAVGQTPLSLADREIIISRAQFAASGAQTGFSRSTDSVSFLSSTYQVPINATNSACLAEIESDSPWLAVVGPGSITGSGSLQYSVSDNPNGARNGNLILRSSSCNATIGGQLLNVSQAGLVCDPDFGTASTHVGFIQSVRSVLVRGSSPVCTWSVSSSVPWIRITSGAGGAGNGAVQFSTDTNTDPNLRQGLLQLNNNRMHFVYQDGSTASLALSPAVAVTCGEPGAQFGLSWISSGPVEVRFNSPTGPLFGQFDGSGSALLPKLADGTVIYLVRPQATGEARVLASGRATVVQGTCTEAAVAPLGVVNGASFAATAIALDGWATISGLRLSSGTAQASGPPYPEQLAGVEVRLSGIRCPLSYVSPTQINFLVPGNLPPGRHLLTLASASAEVNVAAVAPGIFTLNGSGSGVALATAVAVLADGTSQEIPVYQCSGNACSASIIALPNGLTELYLVLYGTGIRNLKNVSASLGALVPDVVYVGAQPEYPGLDQINLRMRTFSGLAGRQSLRLRADGIDSNAVDLIFR